MTGEANVTLFVDDEINSDWIKHGQRHREIDADEAASARRSAKGGPGSGFYGHAGRPGKVGGSAPPAAGRSTDERYSDLSPGLTRALDRIENRIVQNSNFEELVILSQDGKTLAKAKGDRGDQNLGYYVDAPARYQETGALQHLIITHNHPSNMSFSTSDIRTALIHGMYEMRAVDENYVYRLRPARLPSGHVNPISLDDWDDVRSRISSIAQDVKIEVRRAVGNGEMDYDEANLEMNHIIIKRYVEQNPGSFSYNRAARPKDAPRRPKPSAFGAAW